MESNSGKHHLSLEGSPSVDLAIVNGSLTSSLPPPSDLNKRHKSDVPSDLMESSINNSMETDVLSSDLMESSTNSGLETEATDDVCKSLEPDATDYTSDHSYECDYYDEDEDEDNDEYIYDMEVIEDDLDAKFDDLDLPPGVEATVPWLQALVHEKASDHTPLEDKTDKLFNSSNTPLEDETDKLFNSFKQFDTVEDYSDHHFAETKEEKKPPKEWMKKIQTDWKLLENDLPETIFVRVYEERMDLLRAVIIGPAGTPYHDGLFFFDFHFPSDYPHSPPKAQYHSGGLRLNPNLYACGKVCLSLLNTWTGKGCEKWSPQNSTMLQVLVSIQALVLNEKPYFNEPGYERTANTENGQKSALMYNENTFIYSCKTMLYSLRKPPKYFENFVAGHFRKCGHTILVACRAYLDNVQVGCEPEKAQNANGGEGCSTNFKAQLKNLFEVLLMEFTVKGADCKEFLIQKAKVGDATAHPKSADATLGL